MFLNRLNQEEKIAFLKLAKYVVSIDDKLYEKETYLIEQYCKEMNIENIDIKLSQIDIKKIIKSIQEKETQRAILLELIALVLVDNNLDKKEYKFIKKISKKFGISKKILNIYIEWSKSILAIVREGELLLKL